ncbi:hypothetical protein IJ843_02325 [bacterium]|nr:hypothetical protein [bacterium]
MTDRLKNYTFYLMCGTVLLTGFLLRLKMLIDNPSFWMDESALGYNVLVLTFKDFFGALNLQQIAPPLFLVISKTIINLLGAGDFNLRIFPTIVGNISMLIFLLVLNKTFKNKLTIALGLILFCLNPQMLRYTVEFKPYILEVCSTCIILYIFMGLDLNKSYKKLFLAGCGLAIMPWFAFISIITLFYAYILNFSKTNLKKWLCFTAPFAVSGSFFVFYYVKIRSFYSEFMTDFWYVGFLNAENFVTEFSKATIFIFGTKLILIPIILVIGGIIFCIKGKNNLFVTKFFTITFLTVTLMSFLKMYPFYERFLIFLFPAALLLILIVFDNLFNSKKYYKYIVAVLLSVIMILPQAVFANQVITNHYLKNSCAKWFMEYMVQNKKDSDIIIVDNLSINDFLYYLQYYKINNPIIFPYEHKNNRIMYSSKPIKLTKEYKNYWFFSSYTKVNSEKLNYTYRKICSCNDGEILFVKGLK